MKIKTKKIAKKNKKKNIKKANEKTIKNRDQIIILSISVVLVIIATFSITFAYFSSSAKQTNDNVVTTSCYELSFTESSSINLTSYPMSNASGLNLTPYTFTIKNKCDTNSQYQVLLNIKNTTTSQLLSYINYSINGTTVKNLASTPTIELPIGATSSSNIATYLLDSGAITGTSTTKSYNLRMWIDESGGNNLMGSNFEAEVMVYSLAQ